MDRRYVYLDNNGTTRMADEVRDFIHSYDELYGNASSMHTLGRQSAAGIEWARTKVAELIDADSADVSFTYRLAGDRSIPLHGYAELCIGLRHRPVEDSTKYYIAAVSPRGKLSYVGGLYKNGAMHARVRTIASYTVRIDTTPPRIIPVNPRTWGRRGRVVFSVSEKQSGLSRYRATIDGQYALMGKPNSVNGRLVCELDPKHVERGKVHVLCVEVEDRCGNLSRETYEFTW